jgi:3-hydroxybutyryl-CoA dehydrogenase
LLWGDANFNDIWPDVREEIMGDQKNICIAGAGRMGIGISTAILLSNRHYIINLIDLKDRETGKEFEVLNRARYEIESNLNLLRDLGELSMPPNQLMENLFLTKCLKKAATDCEFVFEALPEKPEIKKRFISDIESLVNEKTIVASATSTINLDTFWEVAQRPENIITTHWLNPAFVIPLVEIAIGEKTSQWVAEKTGEFLIDVGKIPVTLRNSPGFIIPRIQAAAMNEAIRILEEGVANAEDIDTAIKAGFGFRLAVLGLIEFIDLGGVDILYHAGNYLYAALGDPQFKPPASVIKRMETGEIGPKTGKGFFDYSRVDRESMFKNRYKGFLELLNLIRHSQVLNFEGGIKEK